MTRFSLLIFTLSLTLTGYCQEFRPFEVDASASSSVENFLGEQLEDYSDDNLTIMLTGGPVEDVSDEISNGEISETAETPVVTQFDYKESKYWGRYTALRIAGWTTFGVGAGFLLGGTSLLLGAIGSEGDSDGLAIAGSMMLFSAPVLVLTSIPLLACAYWNRHKAKKMYLNVEASVLKTDLASPLKMSTPALGLALRF